MELSIWQVTGSLMVALIIGVLSTLVVQRWVSKRGDGTEDSVKWRKNVLFLLGLAYGSLLLLFGIMTNSDNTTAKEAYELLGVPFVALVGGTLTIAKDLID